LLLCLFTQCVVHSRDRIGEELGLVD